MAGMVFGACYTAINANFSRQTCTTQLLVGKNGVGKTGVGKRGTIPTRTSGNRTEYGKIRISCMGIPDVT